MAPYRGTAAFKRFHTMLRTLTIENYTTYSGQVYASIPLSYETFGPSLGTAPIVLVNHALTGNSRVTLGNGWWKELIGSGKTIDTEHYSVLAFNIPGNGYDGYLIDHYEDFSVLDVAQIFLDGLKLLKIHSLFAAIGGSLGGSIAWQMTVLEPHLIQHTIPIATDWKATDWLLAQCRIQKQLLNNSSRPLQDARMHAMTFYRTPQSLTHKFNRSKHSELSCFNVETWLFHHGDRLQERFQLKAYRLMNHLLMTTDVTQGSGDLRSHVRPVSGAVHLIGIDSDRFFLCEEIEKTYELLKEENVNTTFSKIHTIHGHDGFLIEFNRLSEILTTIFQLQTTV